MSSHRLRCAALSCLLATAASWAAAARADALDEAQRLLVAGRAQEARALLAAEELRYAGRPDYDYLYGVALLDSGRPAEAAVAFRRVLAQDPQAHAARLELGRAAWAGGDTAAARRHFEALAASGAPPELRETAAAWLRALTTPVAGAGGWSGGWEFGAGYDTNANAATGRRDFFGILLDPENVEQSSAFGQLAGWFGHRASVGDAARLHAQGRIGHRWNPGASFVDQSIASLDLTLELGGGPTVFSIGAGGHYGLLDGDAHRWGASADAAVRSDFGEGWRATGLLRAGVLRYDDGFPGLSLQDVDQRLVAFSLAHGDARSHVAATLYGADEDAQDAGSAFGNERLGLQVQAGSRLASGHGLRFALGFETRNYDDSPGFFGGIDRTDNAWSASVTADLRDWPARGYLLMPRIGLSGNDSNIPLYEYERIEFSLTLRREFGQRGSQ